jgi:hypothetical protein
MKDLHKIPPHGKFDISPAIMAQRNTSHIVTSISAQVSESFPLQYMEEMGEGGLSFFVGLKL